MCNVTIHSGEKEIKTTCAAGTFVSDLLTKADVKLMMPCAGSGRCGKCQVKIEGSVSETTDAEKNLLGESIIASGIRLACETKIIGDVVIFVEEKKSRILTEGFSNIKNASGSRIEVSEIDVPASSLEDQADEYEKTIGQKYLPVEPRILRALHEAIKLSDNGKIYIVIDKDVEKLKAVYPFRPRPVYAAIDIGTTTLAAYLIDALDGKVLETASALNPQGQYGADVISRIDAAKEYGTDTLSNCVTGACDELIAGMLKKQGISRDELLCIRLVGNTVMMHLAADVSPENIAFSPFIPAFTAETCDKAENYHMDYRCADTVTGPCVSAYVGADTTAALIACGMHESDRTSLLIDIGTNGEIVLGSKNNMVCCSAAAGPAFEGAHIQCGSGAVSGAVSGIKICDDGNCVISTIDNVKPISLCGSGLVDAVAEMLKHEIIDETGRIEPEEECFEEKLFDTNGGTAFPLTADKKVYISQKDIREVQLAKSAIAAGIRILMMEMGIGFNDIDTLYLAGGFGNYIKVDNACLIGLLPAELEKKTKAVGNAAGTGACICVTNAEQRQKCADIARKIRYIELSSDKRFSELFADNMLFDI